MRLGRGGEGKADIDGGRVHGVACDDVAREDGCKVGGCDACGGVGSGAGRVGVRLQGVAWEVSVPCSGDDIVVEC